MGLRKFVEREVSEVLRKAELLRDGKKRFDMRHLTELQKYAICALQEASGVVEGTTPKDIAKTVKAIQLFLPGIGGCNNPGPWTSCGYEHQSPGIDLTEETHTFSLAGNSRKFQLKFSPHRNSDGLMAAEFQYTTQPRDVTVYVNGLARVPPFPGHSPLFAESIYIGEVRTERYGVTMGEPWTLDTELLATARSYGLSPREGNPKLLEDPDAYYLQDDAHAGTCGLAFVCDQFTGDTGIDFFSLIEEVQRKGYIQPLIDATSPRS